MEIFHHAPIRVIPDDTPGSFEKLKKESLFLQRGYLLNAAHFVAPLSPNITRDESLGHIYNGILPENEEYEFEIATELPYFIPNINDSAEFIMDVKGSKLFFCNRMVKAFYGEGFPAEDGFNYILIHSLGLPWLYEKKSYSGLHPLPLKTFISKRFFFRGMFAEDVVEKNFLKMRREFLDNISFVIDILRTIDPKKTKHLLPHVALSSFPVFWLLVKGKDENENEKMECKQFTGDIGLAAHRTLHNITGDLVDELNLLLQQEKVVSTYEAAMNLAITFSHYGYYELAIVHICTACERILSEVLKLHLKKKGMSKGHVDKYLDDETFSHLLNLHLPNVIDTTASEDFRKVMGDINWARKTRNDIVHHGMPKEQLSEKRIKEVIKSMNELMNWISPLLTRI